MACSVHRAEAKNLAVLLLGSYPRTDAALPEVYLRQLTKKLQRYPPNLANKILNEIVDEYRTLPSIAVVVSNLNEAVNALRKQREDPVAPTTQEYTLQGWDAPGVRNKPALAAMMRLLLKAIAAKDTAMHQKIIDVNKDPADWPKFLDHFGDSEWKERAA